jgi:hypothetical protein
MTTSNPRTERTPQTRVRVQLNTEPLSVIEHGYTSNVPFEDWRHTPVAKRSHGRWIVIGPPEKPGANWKCGTDVVWPVIDQDILAEVERPIAFVCRHQLLIGD